MNVEHAIETLKSFSKLMIGDKVNGDSLAIVGEEIEIIADELQRTLIDVKSILYEDKYTKEGRSIFRPKEGNFVKLISEKSEYEIIFDCVYEQFIWYYAMVDLKNDSSLLYTNWIAGEFEMIHSDGSHILAALKKNGKRWNAEKKCIENDDTPQIGDKCIFWSDWSDIVVVGRLDEFLNPPKRIPRCFVFFYKTDDMCFQNCVKYSDEKLIEVANRNFNK
jgi:hypothetical protein